MVEENTDSQCETSDAQAALADHIIWNVESMAFPFTSQEAETFNEVMKLPRVVVTRPPRDLLLKMGMIPHNCHVNCSEYAASDPEGRTKHVWGWIMHGSDFILHSIVERDGLLRCPTPQHIEVDPHFDFVPDMEIEWKDTEGSVREPYRKGERIPEALRAYPDDHIQMRDRFRGLMESGMSAFEARDEVNATLGAALRRKRL